MDRQSRLHRRSHARPLPQAKYILRFQPWRVDAKREHLRKSARKLVLCFRHKYCRKLRTRLVSIILVLFIGTRTESRSCHTSKFWDDFPVSQPYSGSDERSIPDDDVVTYHYILSDDTALETAISSDGDIVKEVRVDNSCLRAHMRSSSNS